MSVLQRKELEESPLADLHAIASELGIEGYRTLRREGLVDAILQAQGVEEGAAVPSEEDLAEELDEPLPGAEDETEGGEQLEEEAYEEDEGEPAEEEEQVTGVLDILPNGSGFVRVDPGTQSRGDVYVAPAQIRRCELRAGDVIGGPPRPPRRNERHPSLVRVETVNGGVAEPPEERPYFSDLTPVHPTERLASPPLIEFVPFGKGSRVAISGPPGAGATTLLREITRTLIERHPELHLSVVLVGVRPEEVTDWRRELDVEVFGGGFDSSNETQTQAAELAVARAKRLVERGSDAAVILDSLESLSHAAVRRVFGAARKVEEGGSLTVIASSGMAWEPQRQASTRIALDPVGEGGAPHASASRSGTLRSDLLSPAG